MFHLDWQNYKSYRTQELSLVFNRKKRSFIQVNETGNVIQNLFEKIGDLTGVLDELESLYDDFSSDSASEINEFYKKLDEESSKPYNYSRNKNYTLALNEFIALSWAISSACNLKCKHCRQPPINELSFEKKIDFINYLVNKTVIQNITITGGEPLIHQDIWKLCNYLNDCNFKVGIVSNGTTLIPEIIEKIAHHEVKMTISLDGSKRIHEQIRGKNTFDRTRNGIKLLDDEGMKFKINKVIFSSQKGDSQEYIRFLEQFNHLEALNLYRCIPTGKASLNMLSEKNKHYAILNELLSVISTSILKNSVNIYVDDPLAPLYTPEDIYRDLKIKFGCLAREGMISAQPDGSFLACQALPIEVANWSRGLNWNDLSSHPLVQRTRASTNITKGLFPEECLKCGHFSPCKGGCTAFAFSPENKSVCPLHEKKDLYCHAFASKV
ncbi:MAG: radical SAM/SPASM domain-containing protein [Candidatus Hodarchaeales archaeon]